jgi:hypothetical protein
MTAWHLTDWTWREIQGSIPRFRSLTASAGTPIRELKQFQEFVKKDCAELAYCEGIAVSTKYFTFSKPPVFSTKVTERFKGTSNNTLLWLSERLRRSCQGGPPIGDRFDA